VKTPLSDGALLVGATRFMSASTPLNHNADFSDSFGVTRCLAQNRIHLHISLFPFGHPRFTTWNSDPRRSVSGAHVPVKAWRPRDCPRGRLTRRPLCVCKVHESLADHPLVMHRYPTRPGDKHRIAGTTTCSSLLGIQLAVRRRWPK